MTKIHLTSFTFAEPVHCLVSGGEETAKMLDNAVFVGQSSKWENPFIVGLDGDRETVKKLYRDWLLQGDIEPYYDDEAHHFKITGRQLNLDLHELRGKDLVRIDYFQDCHAEVLLELANKKFMPCSWPADESVTVID